MIPSLRREILWVLTAIVGLLIVGGWSGRLLEILLSGCSVYLGWHLYNQNRLIAWLRNPTKNIPESWGIWEDIYYQLYQLYRRQRKARKKLKAMLARFKESTQALPYPAVVLNRRNEIEWFNPAASHLFNLKAGADGGQRIENLIRHPQFVNYLKNQEFYAPLEFVFKQRNIQLSVTSYGSGQFLLTAMDITQRRRIDEMRRNFIANASHELRTPITVIAGYTEMLVETTQDDSREPLDQIRQQTERMKTILDDLIELAKLESSDLLAHHENVEVAELLREIHKDMLAIDQEKHPITLSVEEMMIEGSRKELRMAFSNMAMNAIRYSPDGSAIQVSCAADGSLAYVSFKDEGIGIDDEHISRLTERFYRVDPGRSRETGGTGLGLAIVKHVLDRHRAKLEITSTLGMGSEFRCLFPRSIDVE